MMITTAEQPMNMGMQMNPVFDQRIPLIVLFAQMSSARNDKDWTFNISKSTIELSDAELQRATSEFGRNGIYLSTAIGIVASLTLVVFRRRKLKDDESIEVVKEYDELRHDLEICREGFLSVNKTSMVMNQGAHDVDYFIHVNAPSNDEYGSSTSDLPSGEIMAKEGTFKDGKDMAYENLYRRLNCNAMHLYLKAYSLAVMAGFIDPFTSMTIKGTGIDKEGASEYQENMSRQLKGIGEHA
jgi:hypothetical protein